ncbi:zinc finger bed domain-containing protein 1-like [Gigaspora margarita]|uniref:Zinc finger bed domain-containing protein 1-like n=1 Tax=Gigaspora margarita TaxID=4874 RepID=A0A8H3X1X6_GIGMA|nr:zinc finger bed domain-containing protein 1-like [Gigaspora margarita]
MYIYLGIGLRKEIWPKITLYIAKLWQSLGYKDELSAQILISQIIKFKENKFPYNIGYDSQLMTLFMWWGFVEDKFANLKVLDKKIFAITLYSALCENFFYSGLVYELPYGTKNKTDEELAVMIQESYLFESFNLVDNSYILNEENNISDIAMNEVHEFDLEKLIQDQNFE